jgi:cytochrome oxidase Cu insertion factor (SCO1/SenC/PrrC family)
VLAASLGVILAAALALGLSLSFRSTTPSIPVSFGSAFDRAVPESIGTIPLVDEHGRQVTLASFHGKIVVLADFLTSCQDECPISTGALLTVHQALVRDGLENQVVVIDGTVDPQRDTPGRLLAYERYTGVNWTLLTGTEAHLTKFWTYLGASYQRVSEDSPPGIDWQTGKPYSYDVDHSNDVFLFDRSGHERLLTAGLPNVHGKLPSSLRRLLSPLGVRHLDNPGFAAWTAPEMLQAIGWMLGRSIPPAPPS